MIDEAKLIAWLDGELPADEAEVVARAVAEDTQLADLAERHRALAHRLHGGFMALMTEPGVPTMSVARAEARADEPIDFAETLRRKRAREAASRPARMARRPAWAGLAAALIAGLAVGRLLSPPETGPFAIGPKGGLAARGELARALESQLASNRASRQAATVNVALTFRARDGRICRSWTMRGEAGVACRQGDGWAVIATAATQDQGGLYRQAAGAPPGLMATVQDMIAGEPFDAAQEARAKAGGWR
jgi:hypothetical protein